MRRRACEGQSAEGAECGEREEGVQRRDGAYLVVETRLRPSSSSRPLFAIASADHGQNEKARVIDQSRRVADGRVSIRAQHRGIYTEIEMAPSARVQRIRDCTLAAAERCAITSA